MVKRDLVAQKITTANARLAFAAEAFAKPLAEFLRDEKDRDLAIFYLFLAVQECIDLAAHWVADEDWGSPDEAGAVFDILRDKGAIEPELALALRGATGLRNRIAHGYVSIDAERLHTEFEQGSNALKKFLAIAAAEADL